jgi:hypothetical protein
LLQHVNNPYIIEKRSFFLFFFFSLNLLNGIVICEKSNTRGRPTESADDKPMAMTNVK